MNTPRLFVVALVCCALAGVAASVSPPSIAPQHRVAAVITLPYRDVKESVESFYDAVNNRQRLVYNEGQDMFLYWADANITFSVVPVITHLECFVTRGQVPLTSIFPDLSEFKLVAESVSIGGVMCQQWQYVFTVNTKVNTYNFYYDEANNMPVQFHFVGVDQILGSHYDEYLVEYTAYMAGGINETDFSKPDMQCIAQTDDNLDMGAEDPLLQLGQLFDVKHYTNPRRDTKFAELGQLFDRSYDSPAALARAHAEFVQNDRMVSMLNRARRHADAATFALNQYFDWSPREMRVLRGRRLPAEDPVSPAPRQGAHHIHTAPAAAVAESLPASVDWRQKGAVGPVKDQGICGSCWSFGTTGTIQGSLYLATGSMLQLSQQEIIDCSWQYDNYGCGGGVDYQAYEWIMAHGGLTTEDAYGHYEMLDGWCHANATKSVVSLKGYVLVDSGNETALLDALATHGPVSISIDASHPSFSFYASGVYYEPACGNTPAALDHTVLAIGYGTSPGGKDYWLVQNSWSTHWGDGGYIMMSRVQNNCGVATTPTYVMLA